MLTFDQIKELIDLVGDRRLQGLEIERSGFRLKITGQASPPVAPGAASGDANPVRPALVEASAPPTIRAESLPAAEAARAEGALPAGAHILKSPIVGTFYAAPSPDADPFVHVGDRVKRGQVLCIVEAMKLMNEIESDGDGVILEVFPENAQPVEFGEPLFAIRPE